MIVYGTKDVRPEARSAPVLDLSSTEDLELTGGQILQVVSELTFQGFESRLPPALHPTHPPYCTILFYRVAHGPLGAFSMAQVRVSALAGISRFGYAVAGWIDDTDAARELGRRYGYRLEPAEIELNRRYDRAWGTVKVDGRTILEAGLFDPEPVSPADANHQGHLNLAVAGSELVLVQTGPQLRFHRCDRGRPEVRGFASETIGCDRPYWAVSAFTGSCDFLFSPVTVACAPDVPAVDGQLLVTGGMQALS